jgi:hypothetical protein
MDMSEPSPDKPEPSQSEKFRAFAKQVISVPKAEIDRREAAYQKERAAKKKIGI